MKENRRALAFKGMEVDQKKGTVNAYGERFLLIPLGLIHSIEDRLAESLGPVTATGFEYEIGREGGAKFVEVARKAGLAVKSPADIQKIADSLGTLSGWGKLDVVEFDFGKKHAKIRWKNGVSVRKRNGKTPVCHFGRGILTGAVAEILGSKCESIETSCEGKGDKFCEAVIGEAGEISRLAEERR
ncbi:MAG TPA: V4R domain-containing protein [Candidatus Bathyarchaeia archaeon]|nr:V4R domain-containing protein [Candidatus Bathyarchaeia archaeon]